MARIVFGTLIIAYCVLCAGLYRFQRALLYFPQSGPLNVGVTYITLPSTKAKVQVSVKLRQNSDTAVIYFGGNAENVDRSLPRLITAFPEQSIYAMNYRSYGASTGKPSEVALIEDALALFDVLYGKYQRVTVIGRSLGTGIAIHLASVRAVDRLILVTPYNSIQEIAAQQYPFIPVKWLLIDKFESWRYAAKVTAPTLILMAENDTVIPRTQTERLITHFKVGVVTSKIIAKTDHVTIVESPQYSELLR